MDAAAKNAGGVGPGAYVIITSMGSIPAGAHGVVERYAILDRLYAYRKSAGLGCFEPLAEACGKGITPDLLRRLYSGDEVVPIQVWRQVGAGLGNLGVSKLDTNGG